MLTLCRFNAAVGVMSATSSSTHKSSREPSRFDADQLAARHERAAELALHREHQMAFHAARRQTAATLQEEARQELQREHVMAVEQRTQLALHVAASLEGEWASLSDWIAAMNSLDSPGLLRWAAVAAPPSQGRVLAAGNWRRGQCRDLGGEFGWASLHIGNPDCRVAYGCAIGQKLASPRVLRQPADDHAYQPVITPSSVKMAGKRGEDITERLHRLAIEKESKRVGRRQAVEAVEAEQLHRAKTKPNLSGSFASRLKAAAATVDWAAGHGHDAHTETSLLATAFGDQQARRAHSREVKSNRQPPLMPHGGSSARSQRSHQRILPAGMAGRFRGVPAGPISPMLSSAGSTRVATFLHRRPPRSSRRSNRRPSSALGRSNLAVVLVETGADGGSALL